MDLMLLLIDIFFLNHNLERKGVLGHMGINSKGFVPL